MLICYDQRNGNGCGAENPDDTLTCQRCGVSLRFALPVHNPDTLINQRYRIIRMLGHGGFGAVYEAEDRQQAGYRVALKETFDPDNLHSFQDEFAVLSRLRHPHLPRYYDMFEAHGTGYLVMEFVPGQSLEQVISNQPGPLIERQVLGYALQLCDVLAYLHRQQPPIFHRDIKPDNIRLTPEGLIKLVDFGLLKQGRGLTQSFRQAMTPLYAPIEQWPGYPGHTDGRSDIYSLGATLYRLLTGHSPFPPAPERMVASPDPLTNPSQHNPTLSPKMVTVVLKAMTPQPADRYPNITSLERALSQVGQHRPLARPTKPTYPVINLTNVARLSQLNRLGRGVLQDVSRSATNNLMAIASSIGIWLYEAETMQDIRFIKTPAKIISLAFSPDGMWLAGGSDTPNNTVYMWRTADGQLLHTFTEQWGRVNSVAFSADGALLAVGSADNLVRLWGITSGRLLQVLEGHRAEVRTVAFTPNRQLVVSGSADNTIKLWGVRDGQLQRTLEQPDVDQPDIEIKGVNSVAITNNGMHLASGHDDGWVRLWAMPEGWLMSQLTGHQGSVKSVAFSENGSILASNGDDQTMRLWQVSDGELLHTFNGEASTNLVAWVNHLATAPHGATLVSGSFLQHKGPLWNLLDELLQNTFDGYLNGLQDFALSPNNQWLILATHDSQLHLWDWAGQWQRSLSGHHAPVNKVIISSDGRLAASASADKTVRLWYTADWQWWRTLETGLVNALAFSPDGTLLVIGGKAGSIIVWAVDETYQQPLSGHNGQINEILFSPNGRQIAIGGDNEITMWQVGQQTPLARLALDSPVHSLAFSPDGFVLIASGADQMLRSWRVADGQPLHTWRDQTITTHLVMLQEGTVLACGGVDGAVRLWRLADQHLVRVLHGHTQPICQLTLSADGSLIVSGSIDGTVCIWAVS